MAAKFKVFDPVREVQELPLPWNAEILFGIRRSGCAAARKRQEARARAIAAKIFDHAEEYEELAAIMTEVADGKEVSESKSQGLLIRASSKLAAMGLTMDDLFGAKAGTARDVAEDLIAHVKGPLVLDDNGEPQEVTTDLLEQCLEEYPFIAEWVRTEADRLQEEFDKYVEGARKNSPASSAITSGDAPEAPSPASTSSAETGSGVSSDASSSEVC